MSANITLNSIRTALSTHCSSLPRSIPQIKVILKELMSYVCKGIDISCLYENIILLLASNDAEIFKMTSQILIQYAKIRNDCAPMCVNSYRKEYMNEDSYIASYALRMLNYFEPGAYEMGIRHKNAFTRGIAIMGILTDMQVHYVHIIPSAPSNNHLMQNIKMMFNDPDNRVMMNALRVNNEIYKSKKCIDKQILSTLFDRYNSLNIQSKAELLEALETSLFDEKPQFLVDLLQEPINQNLFYNATITQLFLRNPTNLSKNLVTLISRWTAIYVTGLLNEQHAALQCLQYLVKLGLKHDSEFRSKVFPNSSLHLFFCTWYLPLEYQIDQLRMLKILATKENAELIYNEVQNYLCVEIGKLSRRSAKSVVLISHLADLNDSVKDRLISMQVPEILEPFVLSNIQSVEAEPYNFEFEAELLYAAGQFASDQEELVLILNTVITYFEHVATRVEEAEPLTYKTEPFHCYDLILNSLLTVCVKTFLKQPENMDKILIRVFKLINENPSISVIVKDKANYYNSLLMCATTHSDVSEILQYILFNTEIQPSFQETTTNEKEVQFDGAEYSSLVFNYKEKPNVNIHIPEDYKSALLTKIMAARTMENFMFVNDENVDILSEEGKPELLSMSMVEKEEEVDDFKQTIHFEINTQENEKKVINENQDPNYIQELPPTSKLLNELQTTDKRYEYSENTFESINAVETNPDHFSSSSEGSLVQSNFSEKNKKFDESYTSFQNTSDNNFSALQESCEFLNKSEDSTEQIFDKNEKSETIDNKVAIETEANTPELRDVSSEYSSETESPIKWKYM